MGFGFRKPLGGEPMEVQKHHHSNQLHKATSGQQILPWDQNFGGGLSNNYLQVDGNIVHFEMDWMNCRGQWNQMGLASIAEAMLNSPITEKRCRHEQRGRVP